MKESSTTLASFRVLGLGTPHWPEIRRSLQGRSHHGKWRHWGRTGGKYTGLDRLGRLVETIWKRSNEWLAQRLEMGHSRAVSRLIRHSRETPVILKFSEKLEVMLRGAD